MKKIFLFGYTRTNLGDDIFLKMLCEKYPNNEFYINIPEVKDRRFCKDIKNINFIENEPDNRNLSIINVKMYDAFIYIGGSIFVESTKAIISREKFNLFIEKCNKENKPFFYISSNFGPYKTEKYLNLSQKTMKLCTDICFRDKYSFNLFPDISSVRYAPDLVFSYDIGKIEREKNSIGISVIGFEIRDKLKIYEDKYYNILKNSIDLYIKSGKKIYLFSFCKDEGDESGIKKLMGYLPKEYGNRIKVIRYDGEIYKFLNVYKKMEKMICTRFHSMILSLICGQKICCISYNSKINNVIKDLELDIKVKNIEDLNDEKIDLEEFILSDDKKIKDCKMEAKLQLDAVENFLNNLNKK